MNKEKIIEMQPDESGTYQAVGEFYEEKEEPKESPKKERAQKQEKRKQHKTETPFQHQNLSALPNNPVGNVLHGIQTGIFIIGELQKAVNKIMK